MVASALGAHLPAPLGRALDGVIGTRANTAHVLRAALWERAACIARQNALAPPSDALCMPLTVLCSRIGKFDAADAHWPDRDRVVASCAGAAALLHGVLDLTGHESADTAAPDADVQTAGAPGGQAIAMAAGMALAERALAARFGKSLVDHRIWGICEAAELTQGVTHEAVALAGFYRLDRLVLLADATGPVEDARPRFAAQGWAVKAVAADHPDEIEAALSFALRSRKPTLLWCQPSGAPCRDSSRPSANAIEAWRRVGSRGASARRAWLKRVARHSQRIEFERVHAGRLPDGLREALAEFKELLALGGQNPAPAALCHLLIDRLAQAAPEMLCGRQDAEDVPGLGSLQPGHYGGRIIAYGRRQLAAAACANGIAVHGGTLPVVVSTLTDLVDQLPALRLAALLRRRLLHLAFDPPPGWHLPGWSPPGWHPQELTTWLRAISGLLVFRPGCAAETADCIELALRRADGPSLVMISATPSRLDGGIKLTARGGYVTAEPSGPRHATLIAAGGALDLALAARDLLAEDGIHAAVVCLPCRSLFEAQDDAYQHSVLGAAPRFGIDTGCRSQWDRWLNPAGGFIGLDPQAADREPSQDRIAKAIRRRLVQTG